MKTHEGSCHCGAVKYSAKTELASVMECNCSHCAKKGFLLTFVPATDFTLHSGEADLTEYRFNKKSIQHLFCKHCGVQAFGRGQRKDGTPTVMLNVRCLDDVDPKSLTITQIDGKSF